MAGISRLDLPSRKMFIKDLQIACEIVSGEIRSVNSIKRWNCRVPYNMPVFSVVWLQGKVRVSVFCKRETDTV